MRLVPFTAFFGAEIHDYGLTRVSDDIAASLRKLLAEKLVLMDAETFGDAVVRRPRDRVVIVRGKIIAKDGKFIESRL